MKIATDPDLDHHLKRVMNDIWYCMKFRKTFKSQEDAQHNLIYGVRKAYLAFLSNESEVARNELNGIDFSSLSADQLELGQKLDVLLSVRGSLNGFSKGQETF